MGLEEEHILVGVTFVGNTVKRVEARKTVMIMVRKWTRVVIGRRKGY